MTEAEWLACKDLELMLRFLLGKGGERRLRLFACACCRRIWDLLEDERSRKAVEASERFGDGLVDARCLRRAGDMAREAWEAWQACSPNSDTTTLRRAAASAIFVCVPAFGKETRRMIPRLALLGGFAEIAAELGSPPSPPEILRDLYANPFRPVSLDPAWGTSTVVSLAQAAYETRILPAGILDPDRLAILADALEDAGCDNEDILSHLRGQGPHVRGCWVVDLLLGKE